MAVVLATKTAEVNKRSTNLYHAHTRTGEATHLRASVRPHGGRQRQKASFDEPMWSENDRLKRRQIP